MKTLLTLMVWLCCSTLPSFSQNLNLYKSLVKQAKLLYQQGDYQQAGLYFANAFEAVNGTGTIDDRYLSACAWAMDDKKERAFTDLFRIGRSGKFTKLEALKTEVAFKTLHNDPQWKELINLVQTKKASREANYILPIVHKLEHIYQEKNNLRDEIKAIAEAKGWDADEVYEKYEIIQHKDAIHASEVAAILDEHGWKDASYFGTYGSRAIFQSLRLGDVSLQEKYLPYAKEAAEKKIIKMTDFIRMEDRLAIAQNKRQKYGTQIGFDYEKQKYYVAPLEDPEGLATRRAALGLVPMKRYVQKWNIEWDVKRYKKELPKLEKQLAKEQVLYRSRHRVIRGPDFLLNRW